MIALGGMSIPSIAEYSSRRASGVLKSVENTLLLCFLFTFESIKYLAVKTENLHGYILRECAG